MTRYLVLRNSGSPECWAPVQIVEAKSARDAIVAVVKGDGDYVAVPARSWKPRTVTVEQTTKVGLS